MGMTKPSTAADFDAYICSVICTGSVYRKTVEEVCQEFGEADVYVDYIGSVSGTPPQYYDGGCDLIDLNTGDTFTVKTFTYYPVTCPDGQVPTYNTPQHPSTWCVVPPKHEKNRGQCDGESCCLGNPINGGVGNKYQIETDVSLTSFSFGRAYNSFAFQLNGAPVYSVMGSHWNHSYERYVIADATDPNKVYVTRPDGKAYAFSLSGGLWVPDGDIHDQLVQLTDAQSVPIGWRYSTQDNTIEDYDLAGKLVSISDALGNAQTLTYDGSNRLGRVDSNSGESLQFGYDASNRVSTMTDHASRQWTYRYDANDNLQFVDNPDGTTKQYHYEDTAFAHALTGITDERGIRYSTFGYDVRGAGNS